ncbi:MAG: hypothetical protein SGILL_001866 [Bacillariaceae sp.]
MASPPHQEQEAPASEEENELNNYNDGDFEPIPFSPLTDSSQSNSDSADTTPESSVRGSPMNSSPLEDLWYKFLDNLKEGLEPRNIQEMVATPNPWYTNTPTMTPEHLAWLEFSLAGSMPGIFYCFDMNAWAHACAVFFILLHSASCFMTNFGAGAWYIDGFGPLQHVGGDMLLNHSLNSTLLLLGPTAFGPYARPLALFLIFSNYTSISMNFKIHFDSFILKPNEKDGPATRLLQYKMGRLIRRMILCDVGIDILLALACFFGNYTHLVQAVFVYNMFPFLVDLSYSLAFGQELKQIPVQDRTLLSERFAWMRPREKQKAA